MNWSKVTKVIVCGANGRLGQEIVACLKEDAENFELVAQIGRGDNLAKVIGRCDVVIDCTLPDATLAIATLAARHGKALVIGTTGHTDEQKAAVEEAVQSIKVVWAANFSAGMNMLFWLAQQTAVLSEFGWQTSIAEIHHTGKKDSPSGSAKNLQRILRENGVRSEIASERSDGAVGTHTVLLTHGTESLELKHVAGSRKEFALGALRAASWIPHQLVGLYDMQCVLGLRD